MSPSTMTYAGIWRMRLANFFLITLLLGAAGCGSWEQAKTGITRTAGVAGSVEFSKGVVIGFFNAGTDLIETAKAASEKAKELAGAAIEKAKELKREDVEKAAKNLWDGAGSLLKSAKEEGQKVIDGALDNEKVQDVIKALEEFDLQKLEAMKASIQKVAEQLPPAAQAIAALMSAPDFEDKIALLLLGEWDQIGINLDLSEEMKIAILDALDFIDFVGDQIAQLPPYETGLVVGAIVFEFFPWTKAASKTARLLKITRSGEKMKKLGVPEAALARWTQRVQQADRESWCFTGDTLVKTPAGYERIDGIQPGDLVCSRDEGTRQTAYRRVIAVSCNTPEALWQLTYRARSSTGGEGDGDGPTIRASANHPIWSASAQAFVELAALEPGDVLRTWTGDSALVTDVTQVLPEDGVLLFNLEVAEYHTYFVGRDGIWAHNKVTDKCKQFYSVALRYAARGIPSKGGRLPNPHEYQAVIHTFQKLVPTGTKQPKLQYSLVKSVFETYTKRLHPGQQFWKPFRTLSHKDYLRRTDVPKDVQLHHFWPRDYMLNPGRNYGDSSVIEVPIALHKRVGLGFDWHFDDYMMRRLKRDHGLDWPADAQGNPLRWEDARSDAVALFKSNAITPAQRLAYIRDCYQERFLLDIPNIGVDGVIP